MTLQTRGFAGVAAIGGNGREMGVERLAALIALGVRSVTVCLDNDPQPDGRWPGREGALHIAALAATGENVCNSNVIPNGNVSPNVRNVAIVDVLPPEWLGDYKDVDALVRARGLEAFERLLPERQSAATFLASDVLAGVSPSSPEAARRGRSAVGP